MFYTISYSNASTEAESVSKVASNHTFGEYRQSRLACVECRARKVRPAVPGICHYLREQTRVMLMSEQFHRSSAREKLLAARDARGQGPHASFRSGPSVAPRGKRTRRPQTARTDEGASWAVKEVVKMEKVAGVEGAVAPSRLRLPATRIPLLRLFRHQGSRRRWTLVRLNFHYTAPAWERTLLSVCFSSNDLLFKNLIYRLAG